jgi:hypothetical protein
MRHRRVSRIALLLCLGLVVATAYSAVSAQGDRRCFPETGFCIEGRIRTFWEQNGGLAVFGFPLGPQQEQTVEGRPFVAQWFERSRLELHPENPAPYDVLLGRLGAARLAQTDRDWQAFPKSVPGSGCRFFVETGHNICGPILDYWRANGLEFDGGAGKSEAESLALFGLPLSDAHYETLEGGKQYLAQWFERARFEIHPENAPPYDVLLGRLGDEVYNRTGLLPTPRPTPTATSTPTLTPTPRRRSTPRPRPTLPATTVPTATPTPCLSYCYPMEYAPVHVRQSLSPRF